MKQTGLVEDEEILIPGQVKPTEEEITKHLERLLTPKNKKQKGGKS